jgi:hypothetical protein
VGAVKRALMAYMLCGAKEEDYKHLFRCTKQEQWRTDFLITLEAHLSKRTLTPPPPENCNCDKLSAMTERRSTSGELPGRGRYKGTSSLDTIFLLTELYPDLVYR